MIAIKVYPAGFELSHSVPATVDEYNALAPARVNAVLEDAVANVEYRSVFPEFREKLCSAVEKDTGIKRKTKTVGEGDKAKQVPDESEGKYIARVKAELGLEDADFCAKYQDVAQSIMDGLKFDPSVKEREGGEGPKIGKNDLKLAKELLTKGSAEAVRVAGLLGAKLNRSVELSDDAESNEKTLARAFGDYRRQKAAEEAQRTKAELGL